MQMALYSCVLLLFIALICRIIHPTIEWHVTSTAIKHESGNAYSAANLAPPGFALLFGFSADDVIAGAVQTRNSRINVLEDGWPLGPAHTKPQEVSDLGSGRFVHSNQLLLFSASDNSDPRSNGREYSISHELTVRFRTILALGIASLLLAFLNRNHLFSLARSARHALRSNAESTTERQSRAEAQSPSSQTSFDWKQFAIVAVITIVLLEILSAIALYVADGLPSVTQSAHVVSPYRAYKLNTPPDYAGGDHSVDGFRRVGATAMPKPERTYRIFALGGSAMYGIGSHPPYKPEPALTVSETVSSALERKLNDRAEASGIDITFEVINAALIGYQTFQHLVYINETLAHLDPDFFVFLDGNNDFYLGKHDYNPWTEYPYSYQPVVDRLNSGDITYGIYLLTKSLPDFSFTIELLGRVLHRNFSQVVQSGAEQSIENGDRNFSANDVADHYSDYAGQTYLRAYRQIKVVADQLGAGMMVFRQPQVIFENTDLLSAVDKEIQALTLTFMGEQAEPMLRMGPLVPSELKRLDLDFADLGQIASAASQNRQLYIDYCHLTPFGAETVAGRMLEHLWPKLRL